MALKTTERLTLMKEIAARLAEEDWPLVDTTLAAFSLPTTDAWSGGSNKYAYILAMIGKASDEILIELAEHVGFRFEVKTAIRVDPPYWRKDMLRVFIGHLATHREYAAILQALLERHGITSFVAHNDIEPTLEWQNEIETALSTCEGFVAFLHPDFHKSNWTDQEIGFAMGRGVPVFAVRFGQDPYGFIGRFQAFNGSGKQPSELADEIFDAFRKNKQTRYRMADILINMFAESFNYAQSKALMTHLEELPVWEPSYPARLRSAVEHNDQVRDSFGVPDRVEKLIAKRE